MHFRLHPAIATVALLALGGCRCTAGVVAAAPARVVATPSKLVLEPVYVGQRASGVVTVVNEGGAPAEADVSVATPFAIGTSQLRLTGGSSMALVVSFTPLQPGPVSGVLYIGTLEVPVEALGLEVPACFSPNVCAEAHFDFGVAQCVEQTKGDGTVCETSCVTGACAAGTCLGRIKGCDDSDACTVDACSESAGCSHLPVICPAPTNPCQVARCDPTTGCGTERAADGTLCGPDVCTATQVDVCIAGACVTRVRPDTGRCANRWVPTSMPWRRHFGMAYDAARKRLVVFGGYGLGDFLSDTWEWDGSTWSQRTPIASPPARRVHDMAYDAARQRIVLFGGLGFGGFLSDTWEWDGSTWTQRLPATSPSARSAHSMAYDAARQRVVLFGGVAGAVGGRVADTWEWDGRSWTQRTPVASPSTRTAHSMAYDAARQRVLLFGGNDADGGILSDTWEWDGVTWTKRTPVTSPDWSQDSAMAFDPASQRVVLFLGVGGLYSDTWEWNGSNWSERTPVTSPPPGNTNAMAYDASRQRVVLFGGSGGGPWEWDGSNWSQSTPGITPRAYFTFGMAYDAARERVVLSTGAPSIWEWNGSTWSWRTPGTSPWAGQYQHAMAYDVARRRSFFFGGFGRNALSSAWEWDGSTWAQRTPVTSPSARSGHAMAYDQARERVVLFGGDEWAGTLSDTWEWDGSAWAQLTPAASPSARSRHVMAYDQVRQRVVLFGGDERAGYLSDTWEWNGSTWTQRTPVTFPPARAGAAMAYDATRQRVVLFGGYIGVLGGFSPLSDTWEWDGSNWSLRAPVTSPPQTNNVAMVYDEARQRLTLFNGADTWVFLP